MGNELENNQANKPWFGLLFWGWLLTLSSLPIALLNLASYQSELNKNIRSWDFCYNWNTSPETCGTLEGQIEWFNGDFWPKAIIWIIMSIPFIFMIIVGNRRRSNSKQH